MTERKDLKKSENAVPEKGSGARNMQQQSEQENALRPPVDIFEDSKGITLVADLPGVSRDRLNIQVDRETLAIEGTAAIDMPEGMEALYADLRETHFRRSFILSQELDTEGIEARMQDGVLTLSVPKRAEHQPRKIEVSLG